MVRLTLTLNEPRATLPAWSVAVQVTSVVPIANVLPDAGVHTTGTLPSTRSVAVGWNVATAPSGPVAVSTWSAGTVSAGGVVSTTVIWNVVDAALPALSVAVQVTVVVPTGNVPAPGVQVTG